jgi:hypothetical protein
MWTSNFHLLVHFLAPPHDRVNNDFNVRFDSGARLNDEANYADFITSLAEQVGTQ